jgi:hypothetical protein
MRLPGTLGGPHTVVVAGLGRVGCQVGVLDRAPWRVIVMGHPVGWMPMSMGRDDEAGQQGEHGCARGEHP